MAKRGAVMRPGAPDWRRFLALLVGPEGCDFTEDGWRCNGTDRQARAILAHHFPAYSADASATYWQAHGGYCDCEIALNVEAEGRAG